MKSWKFFRFGDIENLSLVNAREPEPVAGEVRLKMQYAALNPADRFLIMGKYPRPGEPPFSVGRDGCGIIDIPCEGGRFKEGDQVIILRSDVGVSREGTLSEYVCVPEKVLAPLPEGWSPKEGAAGPLVHLTAWQALVDVGGITDGKTVLITGASGGVGTAALVQAKALGATVLALSRNEKKRLRLKELGADHVLDAASEHLEEEAIEAMSGGRADIVVENLGGPFLQTSVNLCGERGRIAVIGLMAGLKSEYNVGAVIFKRIRIEGVQVGGYTTEESQEAWKRIVEELGAVRQRPLVDSVFSIDEVQEAFARMAKGHVGKVLVKMDSAG